MAVSKRTRYEVLHRDHHTCRYCGGTAPDVTLTVDHVTPVALGGGDDPGNLVTACRDCNAGKSSTNPDAAVVAQVSDDAVRWAQAIRLASAQMAKTHAAKTRAHKAFLTVWTETPCGAWREPTLPGDWRDSVDAWIAAGLPPAVIHAAVESAFAKSHVSAPDKFRYVAGICWNKIRELHDAAAASVQPPDLPTFTMAELDDAHLEGQGVGQATAAKFWRYADFGHRILMGHIDGRTSSSIELLRWAT
jgi:hypothetical protein